MAGARAWIGCSGWQYAAWKGEFYPRGLPQDQWLPYYMERFSTVEVNNTFYRLPEIATFERWAARTPPSFCMAIKASRYLTHIKRLREPEEPVTRLFERVSTLGLRLGPVLYQLPASIAPDLERLDALLSILPRRIADIDSTSSSGDHVIPHVMEFRHPAWYRDDVFEMLAAHGVALCLHDKAGSTYAGDPVGPFVYIRFHGTSGHYRGSYPRAALARWAERIQGWLDDGRQVFAYFNNDPGASAPRNASTLIDLVGG